MKELKTLSLSITRPLEESSLLMVLGGGGGGNPPDKSKNVDSCDVTITYVQCSLTGLCGYCSNCGS